MTTTSVTPLAKLPSTSTFSFTAPFQQPQDPSCSVSLTPHKQQRRVSLALPSSPRQFPAWSFRDDTSVGVAAAAPSPRLHPRPSRQSLCLFHARTELKNGGGH